MSSTAFAADALSTSQPDGNRAHFWLAVQALRTVAAAHQQRYATADGCSAGGREESGAVHARAGANERRGFHEG